MSSGGLQCQLNGQSADPAADVVVSKCEMLALAADAMGCASTLGRSVTDGLECNLETSKSVTDGGVFGRADTDFDVVKLTVPRSATDAEFLGSHAVSSAADRIDSEFEMWPSGAEMAV